MTDEVLDISALNDLREKVLRGEDVPPEKYHEVLIHVQKLRRDVKSARGKAAEQAGPIDLGKILFGKGGGTP